MQSRRVIAAAGALAINAAVLAALIGAADPVAQRAPRADPISARLVPPAGVPAGQAADTQRTGADAAPTPARPTAHDRPPAPLEPAPEARPSVRTPTGPRAPAVAGADRPGRGDAAAAATGRPVPAARQAATAGASGTTKPAAAQAPHAAAMTAAPADPAPSVAPPRESGVASPGVAFAAPAPGTHAIGDRAASASASTATPPADGRDSPIAVAAPTAPTAPTVAPAASGSRGHAARAAPRLDASWAGNAAPPYPAAARRMGEQGEVRLDVHVAADGTVTEVRLRASSGSAALDRSAIDTVRRWRFSPATVDGRAVAEWYRDWRWVFKLEG